MAILARKMTKKTKKWPENWPKKWPEKASRILVSMAANPSITIAEMEAFLNVGHTTLKKILHEMQSEGIIRRVGPDKGGHWEVVSENH